MNKKRLFALVVPALCIIMIGGCSSGSDGGSTTSTTNITNDTSEDTAEYTLENTIIKETPLYTITANSVSSDEDENCLVEFTIENTSGYDLAFDVKDIYLNGYGAFGGWDDESENIVYADPESWMAQAYASVEGSDLPLGLGVEAGQSTTDICTFYMSGDRNMSVIDEILFTPDISFQKVADDPYEGGSNTLSEEERELINSPGECSIYPTGLTSDTVEYPEHQAVEGEQVIVENEDFTYIIQSLETDSDKETIRLYTYIENNTDKTLFIEWPESQVNGVSADLNQYGTSVAAGKREYEYEWMTKDYDEFFPDDAEVETISFNLLVQTESDLSEASTEDITSDSLYETIYEGSFTCSFN